MYGHTDATQSLLRNFSAKFDATDNEGRTSFHLAAMHGKTAMIDKLLVSGGDIHAVDANGSNILHIVAAYPYEAAEEEQLDFKALFKKLLANGADSEKLNDAEDTPFMAMMNVERKEAFKEALNEVLQEKEQLYKFSEEHIGKLRKTQVAINIGLSHVYS